MTRRDPDGGDFLGSMRDSMRDSYEYIHSGGGRGGRDRERRDPETRSSEGLFGDPRDLAGLLAGGALVGLMSGLLGNANIGNTGIPNAIIPAAVGYGASYFDLLGRFDRDAKNAATGALVIGAGLWALGQGVRIQTARQQAPATVVAGAPPGQGPAGQARVGYGPPGVMGGMHPVAANPGYAAPPQHLPPRGMASGYAPSRSEMPLSEAELISIAQRY